MGALPSVAATSDATFSGASVNRDPTFTEQFKAAFHEDNPFDNIAHVLAHDSSPPDPNFDISDYLKNSDMQGYADQYRQARNLKDATWVTDNIHQHEENLSVSTANGVQGMVASVAAGFTNPMMLLPIGEAAGVLNTGSKILDGAAHVAMSNAALMTGNEAALQASQYGRSVDESAGNILGATLVGGILGAGAGALSKGVVASAGKATDEHFAQFNAAASGEQHVDVNTAAFDAAATPDGNLGAAKVNQDTLESTSFGRSVGLRKFQAPVLDALAKANAPDWSKFIAGKVLRNLDELMSFENPVAALRNSPSLAARQLAMKTVEDPVFLNKHTGDFGNQADDPPAETLMRVGGPRGGYVNNEVQINKVIDDAFEQYRGQSKLKAGANDAARALREHIGGPGSEPRKLTRAEFAAEVADAEHRGDEHAIPQVSSAAKAVRNYRSSIFDEAHNVGLVDDETHEAATKDGNYAPNDWNANKVKADRPGAEKLFTEYYKQKRDAAAARVQDAVKQFDLKGGDVGEMFKAAKSDLAEAAGDKKAMAAKAAATEGQLEQKHIRIADAENRITELTGSQERLYGKILNGRDRGESDLGDLFNEFRSVTTRKKELYRQLADRNSEAELKGATLERRQAIHDKLEARETELSTRVDELEKQLKELTRDEFKAGFHDEDLAAQASQTADRIAGGAGRLPYDNKLEGIRGGNDQGKRGNMKARKFDIPYDFTTTHPTTGDPVSTRDFMNRDIYGSVRKYTRTASRDIEMYRAHGTLDYASPGHDGVSPLDKIKEDYARLKHGAPPEVAKTLMKAREKDLTNFKGVWDRMRGTYDTADDYASPWRTFERTAMNLNYMASLGGMAITKLSEPMNIVMHQGIGRVFGDGFAPMMHDWQGYKIAAGEIRELGEAVDMLNQDTLRHRYGIEDEPAMSRVEEGMNKAAHGFSVLSLMAPFMDVSKSFTGVLVQNRMMKSLLALNAGKKIPEAEARFLAQNFIGKNNGMIKAVAAEFAEHGEKRSSGLHIPNARAWSDIKAQQAWRGAVSREVRKAVITPGQDKGLWVSRTGTKLLGQFRTFALASSQRTLMAGLQQRDASTLMGMGMGVFAGSLVYILKSHLAGKEPDLSPSNLIAEGIDRSGMTGWLADADAITGKVSQGHFGVHAMINPHPTSRYASRSAIEAVLGPTYGRVATTVDLAGHAAAKDWRPADTHAARLMLPFENAFGVSHLYDAAEQGINSKLPPPPKDSRRK